MQPRALVADLTFMCCIHGQGCQLAVAVRMPTPPSPLLLLLPLLPTAQVAELGVAQAGQARPFGFHFGTLNATGGEATLGFWVTLSGAESSSKYQQILVSWGDGTLGQAFELPVQFTGGVDSYQYKT